MQVDLRDGASALAAKTWDVAVFGAGPAGITVAREAAAGGKTVLLCEAGGLEYSEQSQAMYHGTETGMSTYDMALKASRLRFFGGTSNHWTGLCGVFEPSDFWAQRHHELPGWPISRDEVLAHLPTAADILDLPTTDFASTALPPGHENFRLNKVAASAPTRFGAKYRDELFSSPRIDVALNANLVDLRLGGPQRGGLPAVEYAMTRGYDRQEFRVRAKSYVLAMGSIENARVLLNANRQVSAGLGNESDFVGRCFMEHLNVQLGRFVTSKPEFFSRGGTLLSPSEQFVRSHRVGNAVLALHVDSRATEYGRLATVRHAAREAACKYETVREFARKFKDFNCAGDGIVNTMLEQVPDRASRVTLDKDTDPLGLRRSNLHWVINDADRRTARVLAMELAKTVARLGVARMKLADFVTDPSANIEVWYHAHQMGTTRMSKRPTDGVVNPDCRLHTAANVYVAGSSVFSTGGGINPTFTLVMLAVRLGRHLRTVV